MSCDPRDSGYGLWTLLLWAFQRFCFCTFWSLALFIFEPISCRGLAWGWARVPPIPSVHSSRLLVSRLHHHWHYSEQTESKVHTGISQFSQFSTLKQDDHGNNALFSRYFILIRYSFNLCCFRNPQTWSRSCQSTPLTELRRKPRVQSQKRN